MGFFLQGNKVAGAWWPGCLQWMLSGSLVTFCILRSQTSRTPLSPGLVQPPPRADSVCDGAGLMTEASCTLHPPPGDAIFLLITNPP